MLTSPPVSKRPPRIGNPPGASALPKALTSRHLPAFLDGICEHGNETIRQVAIQEPSKNRFWLLRQRGTRAAEDEDQGVTVGPKVTAAEGFTRQGSFLIDVGYPQLREPSCRARCVSDRTSPDCLAAFGSRDRLVLPGTDQ